MARGSYSGATAESIRRIRFSPEKFFKRGASACSAGPQGGWVGGVQKRGERMQEWGGGWVDPQTCGERMQWWAGLCGMGGWIRRRGARLQCGWWRGCWVDPQTWGDRMP